MNRTDFRYLDRLRVRWAEVDAQSIVFNGHYLMYLDTAVAGYWRALALPYHDTMAALQGDLFVRKATLEYEASARYDQQLDVGLRCSRIGNSSMVFSAAVFRGEQRLVVGELIYVFADPATQTSKPVPSALRATLEAFEAREPMLDVRTGHWATLGTDAERLRHAVFATEQKIPAEMMVDAADPDALHAVAYNRLGLAVASGRLLQPQPGVGQIGRMATSAAVRGAGLGQGVLTTLIEASQQRGDREIVLNAQAGAVRFYTAAGFARSGPDYMEAGITHVPMRRVLAA